MDTKNNCIQVIGNTRNKLLDFFNEKKQIEPEIYFVERKCIKIFSKNAEIQTERVKNICFIVEIN